MTFKARFMVHWYQFLHLSFTSLQTFCWFWKAISPCLLVFLLLLLSLVDLRLTLRALRALFCELIITEAFMIYSHSPLKHIINPISGSESHYIFPLFFFCVALLANMFEIFAETLHFTWCSNEWMQQCHKLTSVSLNNFIDSALDWLNDATISFEYFFFFSLKWKTWVDKMPIVIIEMKEFGFVFVRYFSRSKPFNFLSFNILL